MKYIVSLSVLDLVLLMLIFNFKKQLVNRNNNHVVILVPGLSDNYSFSLILIWWWKQQGINLVVFETNWKSDENYQTKLDRLLNLIDKESENNRVSLVGTSAGGSLVINTYNQRKDKIHKIITVCSRLRKGKINGYRGFEKVTKNYPAFKESVIKTEINEKIFSKEDRQKIMTIHALLGDELVPANTTTINQAKNIIVPMGGHMISIASNMTIFSRPLIKFIAEN
jgi:hypothetical protein